MQDPIQDPIERFRSWLDAARAAGLDEPEAMTLATADADGSPSARIVLLKHVDDRGFVFVTNYESCKALEIAANPRAALVFHWQRQYRQVRVRGQVQRCSEEESDRLFGQRPRGSRIGAWASNQSRILQDRACLEQRVREMEQRFPGEVPRPAHWGGYLLSPTSLEFWHGFANRLHERIYFERGHDGSWASRLLAP